MLKGVVKVDNGYKQAIRIVNVTQRQNTYCDDQGVFAIAAQSGDLIVFSGVNIHDYDYKVLDKFDASDFISIKMTSKATVLNEVVVTNDNVINEVSLGIVSKDQKKYTQAERRLQTTGDFKPIMLLGLLAGSMPLDPLINKINGRTKRVKKQIVAEKKGSNIEKLSGYYSESFYVNELGICTQYVSGFKVYVIENNTFAKELEKGETAMLRFMIIDLANKYKQNISCEDK
ncbi:hypothetical protein HNP99_000195 [Flavobacterium sp. 28A]|uniref:hypothetical protein n=1 Tax=Flavobacterium sp. 28A TaxID=2735895 RepID=UPI00156F8092|nr:hypothetical protein [Flavobacterium sp. 28A]NRT13870.1 hypothetical protein [Flavobacterium sp. 28A]